MDMKQDKKDESNSIVATIMQAIDQLPENNKANETKHLIEMYLDLLSINNRRLLWQNLCGEQYNFLDDNKFFTSFSARSNINQWLVGDNKNLPKFCDNVFANELMLKTLEMIRTKNLDPSKVFIFLSVIAPALSKEQKIFLKTLLKKDKSFAFLFPKQPGFSFSTESDFDTNTMNPLQKLNEAFTTNVYVGGERAITLDALIVSLLNILEQQYAKKQKTEYEDIMNINMLLALIQNTLLRETYEKDIFRNILFSSPTSIQKRFKNEDPLLEKCKLSELPVDEKCQQFLEIYLGRYNLDETLNYPWPLIDLLLSDKVNLQTPWQKMWDGYQAIGKNHYNDKSMLNDPKNTFQSAMNTRTLEHVFFELLLRVKVEPSLAKTVLVRCLTLCDNQDFVLTNSLFIVGSEMDTKRYENRAIPEIGSPFQFICNNFGKFYQLFGKDIILLMDKMVNISALKNSDSFYSLCAYEPKSKEEFLLRNDIILEWIKNEKVDALDFDKYARGPLSALCDDLNNIALIFEIIKDAEKIDKVYISKLLCKLCSQLSSFEKPSDDMLELIKVFLDKGANPLISFNYNGSALQLIVLTSNPTLIPILKLFLEKNAENVNHKQQQGITLLFSLLEREFRSYGRLEPVDADFVKLLLENGENPLIEQTGQRIDSNCFDLMGESRSNKGVNQELAGMMIFFDRGYGQSLTPEVATDVLKAFLNYFINNNNALYYQNNKNKFDSIFKICLERGAHTDGLINSHPGTPFHAHFKQPRMSMLKERFFSIENNNHNVEPKIPLTMSEQFEEIQHWIEKQGELINQDNELYIQLVELKKTFDEFERIYQCPLSLDIMTKPVTVSTGISYEESSIVDLSNLSKEQKKILCPKSNKPLARNDKGEIIMFENVSLRQAMPEALKNLKMQKENLENVIGKQINLDTDDQVENKLF